MKKTYKVLASIVAWVLFILGLVGVVWEFIAGFSQQGLTGVAWFALWVGTLTLSVVVMKLMKMIG